MLLKDNLHRLLPAIEKAVSDGEIMESARKKVEELNSLRELYSCIVESSIDGIIGCSLDGVISSWNRGAENIFGYTAGEAVGSSLSILSGEGMPNEFPLILRQVMNGESFFNYETVRSNKKGEMVYLSIVVSPVMSGNSDITGASVIVRDISEIQRTEKKLQASENLYRFIFENSAIPIALINTDGVAGIVNSAFEKLSGYSRSEIEGRMSCSEFIGAGTYNDLLKIGQSEMPLADNPDREFSTIDASVRRVLISVQKTAGEDGMVFFFNDVTSYKNRIRDIQNLLLLEKDKNLQCMKRSMIEFEKMCGTIEDESRQALSDENSPAPLQAVLSNMKREMSLEELLCRSKADLGSMLSSIADLYSGSNRTVKFKCSDVFFIKDKLIEDNICRIVNSRIVDAVESSADTISVDVAVSEDLIRIIIGDNGRQRPESRLSGVCEERVSFINASVSFEYRGGINNFTLSFMNSSSRTAASTAGMDRFSRRKFRVCILAKEQIVRAGLSGILNGKDFIVSGEFDVVDNMVKFIENNSVDVVVVVLAIEKGLDLEMLKALTHKFPAVPIMVAANEEDNH